MLVRTVEKDTSMLTVCGKELPAMQAQEPRVPRPFLRLHTVVTGRWAPSLTYTGDFCQLAIITWARYYQEKTQ